jgi:sugar lactone lactonase YvrE/enterochelin esterase-like enzyme
MKPCHLALTFCLSIAAVRGQEYVLGPDSQRQPGVPQGTVTKHSMKSTEVYPGTERDYWVYVPAQYKAEQPAALMVIQDGGGFVDEKGAWRAPVVFDNLIHRGEMPVTIGVFVNPGVTPPRAEGQMGRYNRSFEYDSVTDWYSQFLLKELLPIVEKQYNITKDPNLRGIGGSSSGAICAFTAAWFRPDSFRRVLSFIGSYANIRGGHSYPVWIRKTEGKPLRVFLQDGDKDLNIYTGNWFLANQQMASALEYAGYETTHVWGTEGHNSKHGGAILPDALRWLWRNPAQPINKARGAGGERHFVNEILDPSSEWRQVSAGHKFTEGPAVDKQGNVYFSDIPNSRIHKISTDGAVTVFKENTGGANGLMFGPDGRLYACQNDRKQIAAYSMDGREEVIATGVASNDIAITVKGEIYFTDPGNKRVWFIDAKRDKRVVHEGIEFPNGLRLSPDQAFLWVNDMDNRWVWSFQIAPDGSLLNGEPIYRLETPDETSKSGADGMTVDTDAHLYVATGIGIQVCDQTGRVVAIISKPSPRGISNVVFGGPGRDTLFVTATDKVFARKLRRKGTVSWEVLKPPQPRL